MNEYLEALIPYLKGDSCEVCELSIRCPEWHRKLWKGNCDLFTTLDFFVAIGVIDDNVVWISDSARWILTYPFRILFVLKLYPYRSKEILVAGRDLHWHTSDYEDPISYSKDRDLVKEFFWKYGISLEPIATSEDILELRRMFLQGLSHSRR